MPSRIHTGAVASAARASGPIASSSASERSTPNPQSITRMRSGRSPTTSDHSRRVEWLPGVTAGSRPPAAATSSGTQWPARNSGSSHSTHSTRGGRRGARRWRSASRAWRPATSTSASRPRPSAAPIARMSRPDAVQRRPAEPEQLRRPVETGGQPIGLAVGHGAHLAERLGDEQIGRQPSKRVRVDPDDRSPARAEPTDFGVDARRRQRGVDRRRGDPGQTEHRRRIVALVGDPDQAVRAAQRRHDLGGGRKQCHHPHQRSSSRLGR